jgi:hypothetical protein
MTHLVILREPRHRALALQLVAKAPDGFVVTIKEQIRTGEQNDKMWAMLGDISRAKPIVAGEVRRHTPADWKCIFMNACGWECQFLPGLDGRPFPQGFRSSQLTKSQMSALIEYMHVFGAEHGIGWSDQAQQDAA